MAVHDEVLLAQASVEYRALIHAAVVADGSISKEVLPDFNTFALAFIAAHKEQLNNPAS